MATFTAGTSFTDGVTGDVTAAKLNALVANATPLHNLITDRTAETSVASDDLVLISDTSDSGALNKATCENLFRSTGTGTAASPAIAPSSDTNTGIFFPAADTVAASTNGTEAVRIDSSGNCGIGTTSPSAKLHLSDPSILSAKFNGGSSANEGSLAKFQKSNADRLIIGCASAVLGGGSTSNDSILWTDGAYNTLFYNNGSERLRIDSSGNVGIGTTSPSAKLHVASGNLRLDDNQYILWGGTTNGINGNNASNLLAFYTNATERLRITSDGTILFAKNVANVGTVGYRFDTTGETYTSLSATTNAMSTNYIYSTGASAYRFYVGMAGTVFATNTTISAISDARLKENIRDIDSGLQSILALKPRLFDWKEGKGADKKNVMGFIAQEIEQVFPDLVDEWKDPAPEGEEPYKSVRQDLIPVLVKAIQELSNKIETLESKVAALEAA